MSAQNFALRSRNARLSNERTISFIGFPRIAGLPRPEIDSQGERNADADAEDAEHEKEGTKDESRSRPSRAEPELEQDLLHCCGGGDGRATTSGSSS